MFMVLSKFFKRIHIVLFWARYRKGRRLCRKRGRPFKIVPYPLGEGRFILDIPIGPYKNTGRPGRALVVYTSPRSFAFQK